ncbi:HEAT repeat-containing 6, partial [Brachionus plicatilis]
KLDKRTIVSYWKSFLESSNNNLFYSVKNDPSPKVRLLAATSLALYLEYVRSFFTIAAADDLSSNLSFQSIQSHQSFLPISYTVSAIVRQLHKDIFICLNREAFQLNQVHLLKCLQQLIKATPYQKLKPGLLYKLILSLNVLLDTKNTLVIQSTQTRDKINVLQEIINCLNTILTNYSQMAEVHLALASPLKNINTFMNQNSVLSSTCSSIMEEEDLSDKFEKFTNLKVPNLNQTRVKYFYESNTASGQMTPNCNQLCDLSFQESYSNSKSWLVDFCIQNSMASRLISVSCLDLLAIIAQHYFDLLKKDLFFEDVCKLILENLNSNSATECLNLNQVILKTIKFTEEFCRCLATNELRQMNSIDLNDCCKLWSSLLNSKLLSEHLVDEQRYLISSSACDCLASIGAPIFELLPYQKRIFCLTNLLHLTKSQSNLIRAASVRALGVYVTFASLKEDQNFLTDLSLCLLNLISNDSNNLVRQKTAWSMSNLSEVLIENVERVGNVFIEEFNLGIWYQLLDSATTACHQESEKLKSYLVRTLGNLINYASSTDTDILCTQLNLEKVEKSIGRAIETLCLCKNVKMLKVKWNLSHAIGIAMKRINACIALMSINTGDVNIIRNNANESIYLRIWYGLIEGFSKLKNDSIDATNEIQHKNTLTHQ